MTIKSSPGAVAVIVRQQGRFAAIRSKKRGNRVGFLAGSIDEGESIEEAAIREAHEEGGLEIGGVRVIGERQAGTLLCALAVAESWAGVLRSSTEGEAFWATADDLTGAQSAYPDWNVWALERLADDEREADNI